ncbi:MAG: hypothetical protein ACREP7_23865, partial [Lysobacter sp.]
MNQLPFGILGTEHRFHVSARVYHVDGAGTASYPPPKEWLPMNLDRSSLTCGVLLALTMHAPSALAIEGGQSVLDGSFAFPHAVSVQVSSRKYCQAVIVSPSHVIATASCLGPRNARYRIRAGSPYLHSGGQV